VYGGVYVVFALGGVPRTPLNIGAGVIFGYLSARAGDDQRSHRAGARVLDSAHLRSVMDRAAQVPAEAA
jgi:hypothetical protein